MPTDLPPDYKPEPLPPKDQNAPGTAPTPPRGIPSPGGVDVVDPTGWGEPEPKPGDVPTGLPTPAGTPVF